MVHIILDQHRSGEDYDKALDEVRSATDYDSGTEFISKTKGTGGGNPIIMIRFLAQAPGGGELFHVCTTVTLKEFLCVAQAMQGCHSVPSGDLGFVAILGTPDADPHNGHIPECGLRKGGLCTCVQKPVREEPFDYGSRKPDGQHETHPSLDPQDRTKFVRPLRLSYQHEKCGCITRMPLACAETYATNPGFYGKTFCCHCRDYFPVGINGEFSWCEQDGTIGGKVGT